MKQLHLNFLSNQLLSSQQTILFFDEYFLLFPRAQRQSNICLTCKPVPEGLGVKIAPVQLSNHGKTFIAIFMTKGLSG
jgi:hypothetical protein